MKSRSLGDGAAGGLRCSILEVLSAEVVSGLRINWQTSPAARDTTEGYRL